LKFIKRFIILLPHILVLFTKRKSATRWQNTDGQYSLSVNWKP